MNCVIKWFFFGILFATMITVWRSVYAADQKTLDFCHEYIGEAIKVKEPDRSYMIPQPQGVEWRYPIYRGQVPGFSNYSVYPDARRQSK